jgi:hypothetical protein
LAVVEDIGAEPVENLPEGHTIQGGIDHIIVRSQGVLPEKLPALTAQYGKRQGLPEIISLGPGGIEIQRPLVGVTDKIDTKLIAVPFGPFLNNPFPGIIWIQTKKGKSG